MLWAMTGSSLHYDDGLLYIVEAETEEDVYRWVAKKRGLEYHRIEKYPPQSKCTPVKSSGLDDEDVFDAGESYDILITRASDIPTYDDLEAGEDFYGWVCCAGLVEVGVNLNDLVQW